MKALFSISLAATLLLSALAACSTTNSSPIDDANAVQGNWIPVKAELGGQPMADALLKTISLKLDDGKYQVIAGGQPDRGTYTLDSTSSPRSMVIKGTEGRNQDKTFPAIYEFHAQSEGDTLLICYDLSGTKRPTEFKTTPGTMLYLVTYSRRKP